MSKENNSPVVEMEVYFTHKTMDGQIPSNIMNNISCNFSRYEVIHSDDGLVTIKVPSGEVELNKVFTANLRELVEEVKTKNAVLGRKLAQRYGITKPR